MSEQPADIAYLLITPGDGIELKHGPLGVIEAQDIVGGDFEDLQPTSPPPFVMLVAEDGKRMGLNPNWGATRVMSSILRPSDFVVGTAIVTGPPDASGELTSIDVAVEEAIRRRVDRS